MQKILFFQFRKYQLKTEKEKKYSNQNLIIRLLH